MNEHEWLTSTSPSAMLDWIRLGNVAADDDYPPNYSHCSVKISDRKLRLWACAAARAVYSPVHPEREQVIAVAESVADNPSSGWMQKLLAARASIDAVYGWIWCATCPDIAVGLRQTVYHEKSPSPSTLAALLREIIGNPFRPVTFDPAMPDWCRIAGLAEAAYDDRRDDGTLDAVRLAVLADALEDSGCDNPDILSHLRGRELCPGCSIDDPDSKHYAGGGGWCGWCNRSGPQLNYVPMLGPHVRGCAVLDLLLGKN